MESRETIRIAGCRYAFTNLEAVPMHLLSLLGQRRAPLSVRRAKSSQTERPVIHTTINSSGHSGLVLPNCGSTGLRPLSGPQYTEHATIACNSGQDCSN